MVKRVMTLSELLQDLVPAKRTNAAASCIITGITSDSRQLRAGDLFLALSGEQYHGMNFYQVARNAGAAAVLCELPFDGALADNTDCPVIPVTGLKHYVPLLADRFYDFPSQHLQLIGITGTDGKTSCAHFIAQGINGVDNANTCGVIGTLGYGLYGQPFQNSSHTTPDAATLRRWLAELRAAGAQYVTLEVSSHALAQQRVYGLDLAVALFTNLTRDHLDYHGDHNAYAAAKQRLFFDCKPARSVLNIDDPFGRQLADQLGGQAYHYSLGRPLQGGKAGFVWGDNLLLTASGLSLKVDSSWGKGKLYSGLLGRFNASNLLATVATLVALDVPFKSALEQASRVANAPGRMECFGGGKGQPLVVVDYAHTPHALEQALRALRDHLQQHDGRLWCVFGCGGDRDPGKRPLMGAAAERFADQLIVTDDNPRSENPEKIIRETLSGLIDPQRCLAVRGREKAIAAALAQAQAQDIVLIAGKGHEDYQIIGEHRLHFSDRTHVQRCLAERAA